MLQLVDIKVDIGVGDESHVQGSAVRLREKCLADIRVRVLGAVAQHKVHLLQPVGPLCHSPASAERVQGPEWEPLERQNPPFIRVGERYRALGTIMI